MAPIEGLDGLFDELQVYLDSKKHVPLDPYGCIAHLKLLHAIETLREDIGYTDGLWDLWDSRATEYRSDDKTAAPVKDDAVGRQEALARMREKRWSLFVARAVDRYQVWWKTMKDQEPLREGDRQRSGSTAYVDFVKPTRLPAWWGDLIPPLDVLMVLHTHMLNPRIFLEDCMRAGHRSLWQQGIPWHLVNRIINSEFVYEMPEPMLKVWVAVTGLAWDSRDDGEVKKIKCPSCSQVVNIPWTSCGLPERGMAVGQADLKGKGYGDGGLDHRCPGCKATITKDLLCVSRFVDDAKILVSKDRPMPGTILAIRSGKPEIYDTSKTSWIPLALPNEMIKHVLREEILSLVDRKDKGVSMDDVRKLIEPVLKPSSTALRPIAKEFSGFANSVATVAIKVARIAIRKMLDRYRGNSSSFGVDLVGAVMRQGIFAEKMAKLGWIFSESILEKMDRLCIKYERFVDIMASNPGTVAVPTLDVDLAWHTHQLAPSAYYAYTTRAVGYFVDHDDKISDVKLDTWFGVTSRIYQARYGEVYSECTCWYCEAIRTTGVLSLARMMGLSKSDKVIEDFHASGAAERCPSDNSAHISAHNAARLEDPTEKMTSAIEIVRKRNERHRNEAYLKARKRAEKKGRLLPSKEEYYSHWGSKYYMYGPWMAPPTILATDSSTLIAAGAACAKGSCGGWAGGCSSGGGCGTGGEGVALDGSDGSGAGGGADNLGGGDR